MKNVLGVVVLALLLVVLGVQIYFSLVGERQLVREYRTLQAKLLETQGENEKLNAELEYLKNPENLEKELRARFNYRREGEKMIIIVPPKDSSTEP